MNYKEIKIDYLETVAEEITLMMGLKTEVVNEVIEVDTIAGKMKFKVGFGELMQDVYRFIYCYATILRNYGIEQRINCAKREYKKSVSSSQTNCNCFLYDVSKSV